MNDDREACTAQGTSITVCPDGPLLVRGPVTILDEDGRPIIVHRKTFALCRCGCSSRPPFCDGTHKRRRRPRRAD
ncbi:MAG: CDGSH iron-sulfur domain-containing protein [Nocardiaceae bacterium]|nr:CDGSH iron-sulfur domain-containing protein [Nocardiaceae bacterium]